MYLEHERNDEPMESFILKFCVTISTKLHGRGKALLLKIVKNIGVRFRILQKVETNTL